VLHVSGQARSVGLRHLHHLRAPDDPTKAYATRPSHGQWPLIELHTRAQMLPLLIHETAIAMDEMRHLEVERQISDRVSMCNYIGNRLCCDAADEAMQTHGGIG